MRNFYMFSMLLCTHFGYAQLPSLVEILPINCGQEVEYGHNATGLPDKVGLLFHTNKNCLPKKIYYRHYAYTIKDKIEVFLQAPDQIWLLAHTIDWHSGTIVDSLEIPEWAISLMFVGSNNLYSQTLWNFTVWCVPREDCCQFQISIIAQDTVCPGDSVIVTAYPLGGVPPHSYYWNFTDTVGTNNFWMRVGDSPTLVSVKAYDSIGCLGIAWTNIPVKEPVCEDEVSLCPSVEVILPQIAGVTWPVDKIIGLAQDTSILVHLFQDGCEFEIPIWINLQEAPEPLKDTSVCIGKNIVLDTRHEWQGDSQTKILKDTIFVGVIKDTLGCVWHDTVRVNALWCWDSTRVYIPNVFAPGSVDNGLFQVFIQPDAMNDTQVQEMQIWSRWGQLVFSSEGNEPVWDGRCADGQMANPAVFVVRLTFTTPEGVVSVVRDLTLINK